MELYVMHIFKSRQFHTSTLEKSIVMKTEQGTRMWLHLNKDLNCNYLILVDLEISNES